MSLQAAASPALLLACSSSSNMLWHRGLVATLPLLLGKLGTNPPRLSLKASTLFYSSSSSSHSKSSHSKSSSSKLRLIPFSLNANQAADAYFKHHSSSMWLAKPQQYSRMKEVYIPFWAFDLHADVHVKRAQVGTNVMVSRFNPATQSRERVMETQWSAVTLNWRYRRHFEAASPTMQLYASPDKYVVRQVERLRPGPEVARCVEAEPHHMDASTGGGGLRRTLPFTMHPSAAQAAALSHAREAERQAVEEALLRQHQADRVRFIDMTVTPRRVVAHPVYVPAFVFATHVRGIKLHTFVSGLPGGPTTGIRVYDENKVATAAALTVPVVLWVAGWGAGWSWEAYLWLGVLAPALAVAVFTRAFPHLFHFFHSAAKAARLAKPGSKATDDGQFWAFEWVRAYSASADGAAADEEEGGEDDMHDRDQSYRPGGIADSRGYYALLDVSPSSSQSDIQAAYRSAVLKYHPDRQLDVDKKAQCTKMFVKVQEAYATLRDPKRRAAYDRGQ